MKISKQICTIVKHKNGTFDMIWKDNSGIEPIELKENYKYCTILEYLIDESEYNLSEYNFSKSLDDMFIYIKEALMQHYKHNLIEIKE